MEIDQMEMTSKQVAEVFGISPITVSAWVNRRGLKARKPMGSRKLGLRIKVKDMRAFVPTIAGDDTEALLTQLEEWLKQHQAELLDPKVAGNTRTKVLISSHSSDSTHLPSNPVPHESEDKK